MMKRKLFGVTGMLAIALIFGMVVLGCATIPLENAVKLEFGGTLPPEILSYFDADQLKDIEAKFVVIQGRAQVMQEGQGMVGALLGPQDAHIAVLITVGKDYRIVQMSRYIKPYVSNGQRIPGEHRRLERIDIEPNMATKYNTLQEAQLASEMGA
jgi:hypothetical protein